MKLRTTTGSLRLRIMRSELARLGNNETLSEQIAFPNGSTLTFTLAIATQQAEVGCTFDANTIRVTIPPATYNRWSSETETGIYATLNNLEIIIEKDFACLDRSEADNADTFDHPKADSLTC